jgi:hypothetical protein
MVDTILNNGLNGLFILLVLVDAGLILAGHVIKNPAAEKKRTFLFYLSFGVTLLVACLRGVMGVGMPDHAIWTLVVELCGGGTIIMAFFVYYGYSELWLQKPLKKAKSR